MPTVLEQGERVQTMMAIYKCDVAEAAMRLEMYDAGLEAGRKQGQAEAQRFLRLALGLEKPTLQESAYWNNPVPLKKETNNEI